MDPDTLPQLILEKLTQGMPALTPSRGSSMAEACAVCLEEEHHIDGARLAVEGIYASIFHIQKPEVTPQMLSAWADPIEATEYGATAIAILLLRELADLQVVRRSFIGPGFDYWVGTIADENEFFIQGKARLEISGIRHGTDTQINSRVKQKLDQTIPSDNSGFPAYIVVVEFSRPIAKVHKK